MLQSRRRMLRSSAVALTGGIAGALGTRHLAQPTDAADATVAFTVSGDQATIRESQSLTAIELAADVSWSYDLPSGSNPETARVDIHAANGEQPDADAYTRVASGTHDAVFLESSGTDTYTADLLAEGVVSRDGVVPAAGGETTVTPVAVRVAFRVVDADDTVLAAASAQDSASLEVTRSAYDASQYGSVSGSGSLTLVVE